jgi:hypothetical protein
MRIVRAYREIAELIFSCTRTVLRSCWLQQARHRPADADLRSRRLEDEPPPPAIALRPSGCSRPGNDYCGQQSACSTAQIAPCRICAQRRWRVCRGRNGRRSTASYGLQVRDQAYRSGKAGIQARPAQRGNQGLQPGPERPGTHDQRWTSRRSSAPGQTRERYGLIVILRRHLCTRHAGRWHRSSRCHRLGTSCC